MEEARKAILRPTVLTPVRTYRHESGRRLRISRRKVRADRRALYLQRDLSVRNGINHE